MQRLFIVFAIIAWIIFPANAQLSSQLSPGCNLGSSGLCAPNTVVAGGPTTCAALIAVVANIVGCWDADIGVTGSPSVTAWTDQSANGYVLGLNTLSGAGAPTSPTFSSSSYNSKAGITFSSAANSYLATTVSAVSFGTNTSSFFVAATLISSSQANGRLISFDDNSGADWNSPSSVAAIDRNVSAQQLTCTQNTVACTAYNITYATPSRFGIVFNNTISTQYLNNVSQNTDPFSFTLGATGRISIAQGQAAASGWDGIIRRIVVTKSAVSAGDLNNIDTFLQN